MGLPGNERPFLIEALICGREIELEDRLEWLCIFAGAHTRALWSMKETSKAREFCRKILKSGCGFAEIASLSLCSKNLNAAGSC